MIKACLVRAANLRAGDERERRYQQLIADSSQKGSHVGDTLATGLFRRSRQLTHHDARHWAGAWVIGLTIHPEAHAQQHKHRPQPIYYCSTDEMPLFEPCKEMKDQRDI
jgi:hypothetical protein